MTALLEKEDKAALQVLPHQRAQGGVAQYGQSSSPGNQFSDHYLFFQFYFVQSRLWPLQVGISYNSKINLNYLDLMLPLFHELCQHKAIRVPQINNTACLHKITLLFTRISKPFRM